MRRSRRRGRRGGFSLLETLVALTLLGMALLFAMSLLAQEPLTGRRLDAHREALEVLDAVHEAVRGGMRLSLTPSQVDWQELYDPDRELAAAERLTIFSEVSPLAPRGLYRVTLRVRYFVGERSFDHVLETLIWRP